MPYKLKDPYRHKFDKVKYRITNWKDYNKSLKSRGNINIWFTEDIISNWYHKPSKKKNQGRQKLYSDLAIHTMKVLSAIFKQRLRQTQGLLESIVNLMGLDLTVPNYSTLSIRTETINIPNLSNIDFSKSINIAIDSTGLKILGYGEGFTNKHGKKHKSWKKLHLSIDLDSQKIIASELTSQEIGYSTAVADLLEQIDCDIDTVVADAAYDNFWAYQVFKEQEITPVIPPRSPSILSNKYWENPTSRDLILLDRCEHGVQKWKKLFGYNKRSLVETAMGRYKKIIGSNLFSRKESNRLVDIKIGCDLLNKMIDLGMPKSYKLQKSA